MHVDTLKTTMCIAIGMLHAAVGAEAWSGSIVKPSQVSSSSQLHDNAAENAFDGIKNDQSRWLSQPSQNPQWVAVRFEKTHRIRAVDVYSGFEGKAAIKGYEVQARVAGEWATVEIEGGRVKDNRQTARRSVFVTPVEAAEFRLWIDQPGEGGVARLHELEFWADGTDPLPPLAGAPKTGIITRRPVFAEDRHHVFVNQSGFNTTWPKRGTAPLSADGTPFSVTDIVGSEVFFTGEVAGGIADFSGFRPYDSEMLYVLRISGGGLEDGRSDPFYVSPWWMQRVTLQPMLDFFVDSRSIVGTVPYGLNTHPWRDSPFYAYSMPSLVHLYLAHPAYYERQYGQIDWEQDYERVFGMQQISDRKATKRGDTSGWPAQYDPAQVAKELREGLAKGRDIPDIVKLIQWGTGWWLIQPESHDHAGTKHELHPETVANFVFFLYAYPTMQDYVSEAFYEEVLRYTESHWKAAGLFDVNKGVGTVKGRYAPGWTVLPNILMYEVSGRTNGERDHRYLNAAASQAAWLVKHWDIHDPYSTKGQRMSEHKTITGLTMLLREYPKAAPPGLREKLHEWATTMISRSNNAWDFRRFDATKHWSIPRTQKGATGSFGAAWNEAGNLASFPSCAWRVAEVLQSMPGTESLMSRLHVLAVSQWDVLFGRNPLGAHTGWRGPLDFVGVERGWPVKHKPVCAYLETTRGAICSSPATEHFPFKPNGTFRHAEGWTAYNSAFNVSLAESIRREIKFGREDSGVLTATGPFFVPSFRVVVTSESGEEREVNMYADDFRQVNFSSNELVLGKVQVRYGYGVFAASETLE